MNLLSVEYIAGYFDGEGTIGIYRNHNGRKTISGNKLYWNLKISVSGAYKPTIDNLQFTLGFGSIFASKRQRGQYSPDGRFGKLCKQSWRWSLDSRENCEKFLKLVLPHLREKKEQAELALQWLSGDIDGEIASNSLKEMKKFQISKEDGLEIPIPPSKLLSQEDYLEIMKLKGILSKVKIGKRFGISGSYVGDIHSGRSLKRFQLTQGD